MKELQKILQRISQFSAGEKAILATVVDVVGSGYRRPGARMLIDANGFGIGTVSGGCLEADVLERAKKVLQTGEPTVVTYDTTRDENSVFGLGMGCRGVVRVLLELIKAESDLPRVLQTALECREPQLIATLISSTTEEAIGERIFYNRRSGFENQHLPENLKSLSQLYDDCRTFLGAKENSAVISYQTQKGTAEVFIEAIHPPLNLMIFGAGYDALPLIDFAEILGWRVTAIDHREAFANPGRLPAADEVILGSTEDLPDHLFADEDSVAVIMTHNYERDREILRRLLNSKCLYIGALGPKQRTEKLLAEIDGNFTEAQTARLHAPVGLDIGADTPEAIALSIAAEIQAVVKERSGGFLGERSGPIYQRVANQEEKICSIVLAAGNSSRLNGVPKQLLEFHGRTFLRHSAETAIAANFYSTVIVLGANAEKLRKGIEDLPVRIVVNENWSIGMSSSIKTGLFDLTETEHPDAVVIMLCDQPLVTAKILSSLCEVFVRTQKPIVACEYQNTVGVPALFSDKVFTELMNLGNSEGAKKIIQRYGGKVALVAAPEAEWDVDTLEDYEKLRQFLFSD